MKAPLTQEEIDYRADLSNKINAISSLQGLFTDIEDKPRRLRILKTLLASLNYGDEIYAEIDAEISAIEEAIKKTEEEEAAAGVEGAENGEIGDVPDDAVEDIPEDTSAEDIDLGTLADLESWKPTEGTSRLLEDSDNILEAPVEILQEGDLPSPTELDSEKDFTENN
jgi:hypothetical protein